MSRLQDLLPSSSSNTQISSDPRLIDIGDEDAEEIFGALASDTARQLLIQLREEPAVPPELADELDTSIQNVHYHLRKLEDADLVEPVDTWYSEKGVEMNVYAPTNDPMLVSSTTEEHRTTLRAVLKRLFGAIAILAGTSLLVQWGVTTYLRWTPDVPLSRNTPEPIVIPPAIPPGVLFFLGGLLILVLVFCWMYYRSRPGAEAQTARG